MTRYKRVRLARFNLAKVLRQKQVSLNELCRQSGIARPALSRLNRQSANPTWLTIVRLCKALKCNPSDFVQGVAG